MKAYLIICILVCSFNLCRAEEVRKDFLIKNWWNRFLVWLVSRFQDKYEGQLSICTLSLYPPFEDIGLLEVMLGTRFGRKSPGKVSGQGIRVSKRGGRMSAEQLSSIIDQDSLDMESSNSNDQTGMEPLVRFLPSGRVCFGVHELSHRLPKDPAKRDEFVTILNSFITFINHQNKYPTKIDPIQT